MAILTEPGLSETRWKIGSYGGSGKSCLAWISWAGAPFTEITAAVGAAGAGFGWDGVAVEPGFGDDGVIAPPVPPPEPVGPLPGCEPPEALEPVPFGVTCWTNG